MSQKQLGSFHLKAKSVETLKQLVSVINVLADEVPLELNENGIHVRVMDPSRVAMIDAAWPKTIFEEYNCPEPILFALYWFSIYLHLYAIRDLD